MADPRDESLRSGLRFLGLGFELAASVAGFSWLGWWLGGRFGGHGATWGLLIGFALGFAGGMLNLIRSVQGAGESGPRGPKR
jgi:F0F1-type ATP synthase assembly protein I